MKMRYLHTVFLAIGVASVSGASTSTNAVPGTNTPSKKATGDGTAYPIPPAVLPGKGLAEHDFLYAGEGDTRRPVVKIFLIKEGKVAWTYQMPRVNTNGVDTSFSDIHMLSNGDIVFAYQAGWRKIDKEGKTIYDYRCPQTLSNAWTECHSAQPIGMDKVLFVLHGQPGKLILYNIKTGQTEMEHVLESKHMNDSAGIHGQFDNVRMTKAGTYLVPHTDLQKVVEYDKDWNEIWSYDVPGVWIWQAVRLKNGNTLISGNHQAFVREVNPEGETVWEVKDGDLPGIKLYYTQQMARLANGNTVFCNWASSKIGRRNWPNVVQVIEVTPDKKVVWALNQWKNPDLGPASCIQLLDQPGNDEDQDLMR
jgi:hypothetical protein